MMRHLVLSAVLVGALHAAGGPAIAQERDVQSLADRLNRLERDMNQLQRQVYRHSSANGAPVPMTPADAGTAVNIELRMDQLESQMRTLTGKLEEVTYNIDQLGQRVDKLASDVDMRLTALEHPGGAPAVPPSASGNAPPEAANSAKPAGAPNRGGVLTAPAGAAAASGAIASRTPESSPTGGPLPSGDPQAQYNYAFGLLRQADYPAAAEALRSFIQRYPNSPLAGNAQYWLGETFYVRKDYARAASAFAEGYKKYPKSSKSPDNLLKLGMSLGNLGQKQEACLTLHQLDKDFPTASANIRERASQERQHLGC